MKRVMLVDDSRDVLNLLQHELEWLGYQVEALMDGAAALSASKRMPPDVIISDLGLPGMDGFEFIRRVRTSPRLASIPAIALTGSDLDTDIQRALALGFTTHLTKPVEMDDLVKLIEQLTSRRSQRKAG